MLPRETQGLLVVERDAEVPAWLDWPWQAVLEPEARESPSEFGERACESLRKQERVSSVVIAVAVQTLDALDEKLGSLGRKLAHVLRGRDHARILFCVPAEATEKQRKSLLSLTHELAKDTPSSSSVVVGAHFSARPPPSGTLPAAHVRTPDGVELDARRTPLASSGEK